MEAKQIFDIHTHNEIAHNAIINYRLLTNLLLYPYKEDTLALHEDSFYSAGIHPWELTENNAKEQFIFLEKIITEKQFIAIGEAGLDKLAQASMKLQTEVFEMQVYLSERLQLPLIIHCVKAMDELLAVRKKINPIQPWIWHGFRGKPEQAAQLLKKRFYISFGNVYPNETMKIVPDERLFLETDTGGLDIESVFEQAAKVRETDINTLRQIIGTNIQKVFFKG